MSRAKAHILLARARGVAFLVHFDGGCEPFNPGGVATFGYLVHHDDRLLQEGHGLAAPPGPDATNNVAEYAGVLHGLAWLAGRGTDGEAVLVRGDSRLVIEQMAGKWRVNAPRLVPLHKEAVALARQVGNVRFEWVPRARNAEADALAREAYLEAIARHPEWARLRRPAPRR